MNKSITLYTILLLFCAINCATPTPLQPKKRSQPTFDDLRRSELIRAVINGNEKLVETELIQLPNWKDYSDSYGMTALHYAAASGNESIFQLLVRNGVKLQVKDNVSETVMHKFARVKMNAPIQYLQHKGVSIDDANKNGFTPLQIASIGWNSYQVKRFLEQNANVNIQNSQGKTPLHLAIESFKTNDSLSVKKLQKDLASPPDTVKKGFWILTKERFKGIGKATIQFFKNIPHLWRTKTLLLQNEKEGLKTVEYLLDYSPDLRIRDTHGNTAIAVAKKKKHYLLTKLLIKRGLLQESDL